MRQFYLEYKDNTKLHPLVAEISCLEVLFLKFPYLVTFTYLCNDENNQRENTH